MTAPPLLLALHSCSDCFGMALLDPQQPGAVPLVQAHPDGRGLSNSLISRVQALLPPEPVSYTHLTLPTTPYV